MSINESTDWRSEFRLHAMDMIRPAPMPQGHSHWMLRDETIREWISDVANENEKLAAAGGDPFRGEPMTLEAVIDKLGFADQEKPRGLLATATFTLALVVATTHHATAAQRQALRLRHFRSASA